jgi:hypothetical protein
VLFQNSVKTIFIQIAAYRDPELIPTIENALSRAAQPERLRFGICNQTEDIHELDQYSKDFRFRITTVDYYESKGVCWARHLIQKQHFKDETYTLQLDSHHRFVNGWDEKLIEMLTGLQARGIEKPLITAYVPSFDPSDVSSLRNEVWVMTFDRFTPEGVVLFMPVAIPDSPPPPQPIPARFYSAHFAFTVGPMCREVPHDPNYYFHGEEINIAARAFTHGYDLFHPNEVIAWHEYKRIGRPGHLQDHPEAEERRQLAFKRNRILFGMESTLTIDFAEFGFGPIRTLQDYEQYAGIRFRDRKVQRYTLEHKDPPNPIDSEWIRQITYPIKISRLFFPEADYQRWAVAFHDAFGKTIYREDADGDEIRRLLAEADPFVTIRRSFVAETDPARWVIRPYSASKGWGTVLYGQIGFQ